MSNKQKTAVQDFWDNISLKLSFEQIDEFVPLFYQAKEMEKEQMIQFAIKCMFNSDDIGSNLKNHFIQKYNEEFGGNK